MSNKRKQTSENSPAKRSKLISPPPRGIDPTTAELPGSLQHYPHRPCRRPGPVIGHKAQRRIDHRYRELLHALLSQPSQALIDQLYHYFEQQHDFGPLGNDSVVCEQLTHQMVQQLQATLLPDHDQPVYPDMALSNPLVRTYWMAYRFTDADLVGNTTASGVPWSGYNLSVHEYLKPELKPFTGGESGAQQADQRLAADYEAFERIFTTSHEHDPYATTEDDQFLQPPGKYVTLHTLNAYAHVLDSRGMLDNNLSCWRSAQPSFTQRWWHMPPIICMIWEWEQMLPLIEELRHTEGILQRGVIRTYVSREQRERLSKKRISIDEDAHARLRFALEQARGMNPFALPAAFREQYIPFDGEYLRSLGANGRGSRPIREFNPHELLADSIGVMQAGRALSDRQLCQMTTDCGRTVSRARLSCIRREPESVRITLEEAAVLCEAFRIPLSWWLWGITRDYALYRSR